MKQQAANVWLMQKMNRAKVLNYVRCHPYATRPQIAAATGLSLASLTNITAFLLEKGLLKESGIEQVGRVGRKSVLLTFQPERYCFLCLVLMPGIARLMLTDLSGSVLQMSEKEMTKESFSGVVFWLSQEAAKLREVAKEQVLAVGAAVSGLVLNGRLVLSSSLGYRGLDLQKELESVLDLPVFVENTTMARAVWQFRDSTKEQQLYVDLEGGVGAAQLSGGKLHQGMIGEIGHTTIEKGGDACFCGNHGCLEVMCAPQRMCRQYERITGRAVTAAELEELQKNDDVAKQVIADGAAYLGMGLSNLIQLFNPNELYINRGLFAEIPTALRLSIEEIRQRVFPVLCETMQIRLVSSGDEELVRGIALGLCDRVFSVDFADSLLE